MHEPYGFGEEKLQSLHFREMFFICWEEPEASHSSLYCTITLTGKKFWPCTHENSQSFIGHAFLDTVLLLGVSKSICQGSDVALSSAPPPAFRGHHIV